MSSTIDPTEIKKFSALAKEWWNEDGPFKPLHRLNAARVQCIRDIAIDHFKCVDGNAIASPLSSLSLLDVGCGGGLLSEPMARLGAHVTGIDASSTNIQVARMHAEQANLAITYHASALEDHLALKETYDIVLAMEIIEHVADVEMFVASCVKALKPGGLLFISTLNRTAISYLFAIIGAEYLLRWLPRGTHQWSRFVTPAELATLLEPHGFSIHHLTGINFEWWRNAWTLSPNVSVNYIAVARV